VGEKKKRKNWLRSATNFFFFFSRKLSFKKSPTRALFKRNFSMKEKSTWVGQKNPYERPSNRSVFVI